MHWASWDDAYVVFDEGSGQTHQMDSVRAFVLDRLCEGVQSTDKLAAELASIPALADTSGLAALVETILDEFCGHGLAEVASA
ncbi:HPr-rel-A system PqqD family peptide chaperone [Rhodoferax sp. WC2427]|uniref:HPr-rel-A system PqqD family peptide chaperone n=1 Tax=Rhodoferax sp. WC2427 TaxID=3234144 RepID=UPI0034676C11